MKLFLTIVGFLVLPSMYAQELPLNVIRMLEYLSENIEEEDADYMSIVEELERLHEQPIHLNSADAVALRSLVFLDEFQVQSILEHRSSAGRLVSVYELQGIEGLDAEMVSLMLPFVRIDAMGDGDITWSQLKREGRHEVLLRAERFVEPQAGYAISDGYLGNPYRLLTRYRFRYMNHISTGFTLEKDAGEPFGGRQNPLGFDHGSAHLYFSGLGKIHQLAFGDFQAQFGQGLTQWMGLAFGRSGDIKSIKRNARGIIPFTSADENMYLRGTGMTLRFGPVDVSAFGSHKKVDARIHADSTRRWIQSFPLSGLHATHAQRETKDAATATVCGGHLRYRGKKGTEMGLTTTFTGNDLPLLESAVPYKSFHPSAPTAIVSGIDYQTLVRNVLLFGESSIRWGSGGASVNGLLVSLGKETGIAILHRYYSPSYLVPHSNPISKSGSINEMGTYLGLSSRLRRAWKFNAFVDLFRFPWLRYQVDSPSEGVETMVQIEYRPNREWTMHCRISLQEKPRNFVGEDAATNEVADQTVYAIRLNWESNAIQGITLRGRVEHKITNIGDQQGEGWLIYQDLIWKPAFPSKYTLKIRYAMFDSDAYDARLYAYEHDVPFASSIPAYYGRGCRFYFVANYKLHARCTASVRFAQTYFSDRDVNGSGLNEMNAQTRTQVKAQLHFKL
ncbi:MAG: helix-hairpin-helix domain-containing protein [Cryomorphaceae bacterium]